MRGLVLVAAAVVALAFAGAAPAASVTSLERTALAKLKRAPVSARDEDIGADEIARAAHLIRTLPNGRELPRPVALQEVASFRDALTQPRALALYGALRANDDYFAKHWAPADKTDIVGADGVVYRYFGGHCFRFHPLANFGVLNARATAGDVEGDAAARRRARRPRRVPAGRRHRLGVRLRVRRRQARRGSRGWRRQSRRRRSRAPRRLVPDERDRRTCARRHAAYRVIPQRLLTSVAAGPWIRLYAFSSLTVLNAQLQATISLQAYATASGDPQAQALAARMQNAAAASLAAVRHRLLVVLRAAARAVAAVDYHHYVVSAADEAEDGGSALRRRGDAVRRVREGAARVPARERRRRPGALLALEAGDRRRRHRRGADEAPRPARRLAHASRGSRSAPASTRCTSRRRTGTATRSRSTRRRSCASAPARSTRSSRPPTTTRARRRSSSRTVRPSRWPDGATAPDPAVVASLAATPAPLLLELDALTPATPCVRAVRSRRSRSSFRTSRT